MNQMPLNCSAEHVYVLWISEEEEKEGTPLAHWWRMGWVEEGGRDRTQEVHEPSRREVTAVWVRHQGNRVNGPFEIARGTGRQALDLGRTQGESQKGCLCVPPALS